MAIRYRKNINCLTEDQLHDLREALTAMYALLDTDAHSYEKIAGLHGSPSPSYCIHGYPGFLTWHRAYLYAYEEALRCINPDITLPFWNWSSGPSTGVPAACRDATYEDRNGDTVDNPLFAGPLPSSSGGGFTSRRADIDSTSFDDIATSAQSASSQTTFSNFQTAINGPHGSVHVRVSGNMGTVATAGFDPIFYLHHANVDRLWAIWQNSNTTTLPTDEASLELEPFNKPYSTQWRLGSDVATTDMLGYRYTNFCFIWWPWLPIKVFPLKLEKVIIPQFRSARLVFKADSMPVASTELRVFIDGEKARSRKKTKGNARFAGSVAMFGMGDKKLMSKKRNKGKNFDISVDISDAIKQEFEESGNSELTLAIVAVDKNGKSVPDEQINIKGLELFID
jgi:hypothetical protein